MNILIAHNFYKQPGGEDQCVAAEIEMLKSHGHEVTEYYLNNCSIDQMSTAALAVRTIWNRRTYAELRRIIKTCKPQIAHFHNTFPLISPAAYYAARREGARVVQTLHNFRLVCPGALLFRDGKVCEACLGRKVAWPGVLHKCYHDSVAASGMIAAMVAAHKMLGTWSTAVDKYIALTDFSKQKLVAGGIPAEKISVKANFVYPDPQAGPGDGRYGLYVGRLSSEKGLDVLLRAWAFVTDFPLLIIGDGPLRSAVTDAAASNLAIQWLGAKPLEIVYEMIGNASFLILPSRCYENFPRVIVEAFAKGTPVIAPNHAAMASIVTDGETGFLFEPGNSEDLCRTIRRIASDAYHLAAMRPTTRQAFCAHYTAHSNYQSLMAIYNEILDGGNRRPSTAATACVA